MFQSPLLAQEINFGEYSSKYAVGISELNPSDNLSFGMIIKNEGAVDVDLADSKVMVIEGVNYLDIIVDVTAENELLLNDDLNCIGDVSCSIPFTLKAAYANRGSNNINHAKEMTVSSNFASAQFPIEDKGNQPPGPPPTPVHEGYDPSVHNQSAYLYIYGTLNVGSVDAGSYSSNITITISYD